MFTNRVDAGQQLADALKHFRAFRPLILALPRGGVVVGAAVARQLSCLLDVLLVKKLRAPDNPELAIGAVCEEGRAFINEEIVQMTGADRAYVEREIAERRDEIAGQRRRYRAVKPRISPAGMTTILVDDGLATGATMMAAVQATALAAPRKLVVAVPVAPPEVMRGINTMKEIDEAICLLTPAYFSGVGQFYRDFTQVSDEEVTEILREFA
jgi:predicted phosphoribosyltransferase